MKKYLYIIFCILFLSGCSKDLNLNPSDTFSDDNAFLTITDLQNGLNGAYGKMSYSNDMYVNAIISDEAKLGPDNAGQGALTYRLQYSSDAVTGGDVVAAWGGYYAVIDQVNRVIAKVSTVTASSASQEAQRGPIKGQLLALRAFSFLQLLESYCKIYNASDDKGVPVLTESNLLGKPARNTVTEVTQRIEEDLDSASILLSSSSSSFSDSVFNKVNVDAIRARYYLYKNDWANAIKYSTNVINSKVKPLVSGDDFRGIWTDANTDETLFRTTYTGSGIGGMWTTTNGLIYIAPSNKLINSYDENDIRKQAYIGTSDDGSNYVNKFYESSRGGGVVDAIIFRTAEMYLIRAEAYAKSSSPDIADGASDLNLLRSKRITGYTNETFASASDLLTAVYQERFKELCFEGFRFFDLKRNSLPLQRDASDASGAWQTMAADNYRWVLPIPQQELDANPNIVQNDGYNNN